MTESTLDEQVLHRIEDGVCWITLNRPEAANAITYQQRNRVIDLLEAASSDYHVRAVVITAAGAKLTTRQFNNDYNLTADGSLDLPVIPADGTYTAAVTLKTPGTVNAGVVEGRTLTSYPSPSVDLQNAGVTWKDEDVVVDDRLITSRNPDDLPAFVDAISEALAG